MESDVQKYGACFCGLYVSKDVNDGKKPFVPVPESRPREKTIALLNKKAKPKSQALYGNAKSADMNIAQTPRRTNAPNAARQKRCLKKYSKDRVQIRQQQGSIRCFVRHCEEWKATPSRRSNLAVELLLLSLISGLLRQ
jgi:hypothetical protein